MLLNAPFSFCPSFCITHRYPAPSNPPAKAPPKSPAKAFHKPLSSSIGSSISTTQLPSSRSLASSSSSSSLTSHSKPPPKPTPTKSNANPPVDVVGPEPPMPTTKLMGPESDKVPAKTAGHALPIEFPLQPPDLSWRALGMYTCLRTLSRLLALSPFSSLSFLRGLCIPFRSILLDEIHVNLLRVLAKKYKAPKNDGAKSKCHHWAFLDRQNWPIYFHQLVRARKVHSVAR